MEGSVTDQQKFTTSKKKRVLGKKIAVASGAIHKA